MNNNWLLMLVVAAGMVMPVTSRLNSVQAISYKRPRKSLNGPPLCALDQADETMSSSLKDCSLKCGRDGTCNGINIKNSLTCDVYNYKPKITALVSDCMFYHVTLTLFRSLRLNLGSFIYMRDFDYSS